MPRSNAVPQIHPVSAVRRAIGPWRCRVAERFSSGFALAAALSLSLLPSLLVAQEAAAPQREALAEIPERFFQWQDSGGFFWQATENGALTSAGTQYLQSGLNLVVEGEVFAPAEASTLPPERELGWAEIELRESREGYSVRRHLRFDRERQAVRVLDTFTAEGGASRRLRIDLRTTYPFGWQTLHGTDGSLLSSDPALTLGEGHEGLVIRFSPTEGRHETVLITGRGGVAGPPRLSSSGNQRQLTLSYELALEAGEELSLLHWISQRNLPETGAFAAALSDLTQRGRLVRPLLPSGEALAVANFPREAIPEEVVPTAQLRSLMALNEEIDRLGIQRRGSDLLWVSGSNQALGTLESDGDLVVQAAHLGERRVSLPEVAALKGGAGAGRRPLVFLRDGRVLAGGVASENLRFVPEAGGPPQAVDLETLNLLLMRAASGDGAPPENGSAFLRLIDGTVLALGRESDFVLETVSILGPRDLGFSEVREIGYLTRPVPAHRLVLEDGSRLSLVLRRGRLPLSLADGTEIELSTEWVDRMWRVGSQGWTVRPVDDAWLDFSEVPGELGIAAGFLLTGNQLLAARLSEGALRMSVDGVRIEFEASTVRSLRRMLEGSESGGVLYAVERSDGEILVGEVESPVLEIVEGDAVVPVAMARLLEYRAPDGEGEASR